MKHLGRPLGAVAVAAVLGFALGRSGGGEALAQGGELTALDYQEITQLINRYAYGIDTCANNGYDYANVFTPADACSRRAATRWPLSWAAARAVARRSWCGPIGAT